MEQIVGLLDMKRYWLVLTVLTVLVMTATGCLSSGSGAPEVHTYQLSLDGGQHDTHGTNTGMSVLLVNVPQAEPGFETSRMVYLKRPYELEYYAVNQWAEAPARMFAPLLVQVLNHSGVWRDVVPLPSSVQGAYRLDSYGFAVQQEFLQQPSRVRVMVRLQLVDLKEMTITGMQTFEQVEQTTSEDAYGGVLAANRAVTRLLDHAASWLRHCVQHSPECRR